MELTITQNGALYAVQHAPSKRSRRKPQKFVSAGTTNALPTLRTSVGEFALDAGNAKAQVGALEQ